MSDGIKESGQYVWDSTNEKWVKWDGDISIAGDLVDVNYDSVEVEYTDATKKYLDTVVFKSSGSTVATLTVTYPSATQEIYTKT